MKATGIVRRIDSLGRVVIPKEIRNTLNIHEGDPLEIFTENDGVTFRRYNFVSTVEDAVGELKRKVQYTEELKHRADILNRVSELEILMVKERDEFEGSGAVHHSNGQKT